MRTHDHSYSGANGIIKFCRRKLYISGLLLIIFSAPAMSQVPEQPAPETVVIETPPSEPPTEPLPPEAQKPAKPKSDVEEVVVVGSRIRRSSLESISPVMVVTREEMTSAGFNSVSELLQSNSITGGASQINNAYGGYVTNGGPGSNTISLRGLGESRTLVLINGRRIAPAGTRGSVGSADLNVLPTAMIEHVEVLQDGASSIYGSDAIGGVINVITMDAVEGLTLEGDLNLPTEGAGEQYRFSISGGYNEERLSLSGSFDYFERRDLALKDRDWTKCNVEGLRDPQTGEIADFIDPLTNKPKCYPLGADGTNGVTINTIGTQTINEDNWETLGLSAPPVGAAGSVGMPFNRFRPNALITTGVIGFEGVGGGVENSLNIRDTFEPRMLNESLISPVKIYTSFLQGNYDLQALGDAKAYFELLLNRRESTQTGYRQLTMDYRRGSPLIPDELAFGNFGADQGTSDGDRVGVRAFIGFGNDTSSQNVDFIKPTFGIKGDLEFLPDWKYDVYTSHSRSDGEYIQESFLIDKLTYASDAVTATGDIDPGLVKSGLTCEINLTNPNEQCIPFPALTAAVIGGNLPDDFKNYIFREVKGNTVYEETMMSIIIDGPLFDVPAGQVQGVFGLEYREAEINDKPDPNSVSGNLYNLSIAAPTKGSDNVSEIYSEIEIPILDDVPFVYKLTTNGSIRYTDYDSYGSDETYKIGFMYSPNDWIALRGSKGTSFRAPALFEQFQGATSGFRGPENDPCNEYGNDDVPATVAANCASELPGQPDFIATSGVEVLNKGGANAGLYAETSENLTYGITIQPEIGDASEFSFAVDYFDIKINNGVDQAGYSEILSRCYNDPDFRDGGGFCRFVTRDPVTAQLTVSDSYTNLATQISRGLEITQRYEQDLGPGSLLIDISWIRYYQQSQKLFADDELEKLNGTLEFPEYSANGYISYTWDDWRITYGIDWISSMDSYDYLMEAEGNSFYDFEVPSYFEHRISLRYQAASWETTVGVRNLTNEVPPTISSGYYNRVGNAPLYSGYDYVGREAFINVLWNY